MLTCLISLHQLSSLVSRACSHTCTHALCRSNLTWTHMKCLRQAKALQVQLLSDPMGSANRTRTRQPDNGTTGQRDNGTTGQRNRQYRAHPRKSGRLESRRLGKAFARQLKGKELSKICSPGASNFSQLGPAGAQHMPNVAC